jgi:cytosine/uracil/thiamine/allantoin permease
MDHMDGFIGMVVTIAMCSISISANIFNEMTFKQLNPKASQFLKSAYICAFGSVILFGKLLLTKSNPLEFFNGWDEWTVVLLIN